MGVFLIKEYDTASSEGLPHARGGVSISFLGLFKIKKSSPRPWGCFSGRVLAGKAFEVFPTPVGVFPKRLVVIWTPCGLPHARGGVSVGILIGYYTGTSSPRPWGCFFQHPPGGQRKFVFPTPVGVFLIKEYDTASSEGLPHARGGVSPKVDILLVQ